MIKDFKTCFFFNEIHLDNNIINLRYNIKIKKKNQNKIDLHEISKFKLNKQINNNEEK
jgi:hypothetical protein